ncbi:DUF2065 domain-containing protein [Rhizobium sp. KVB221]|uniref:DUF2065 domain-containing protein n=1 Tax=Rhizobium setariae TaxID=2801340 RepID=A0A936YPP1_9HYPH|nr:DUF2065 domain-containing protein [Rhizobium setariae]MBL0374410.1 DUF2065 domain-containing protein [Rhizobium setariae]
MNDVLTGLAFFLVIEGLLYAAAPSFVKKLATVLPMIPERQLRTTGLIAMALGVAGIWLIRGA